MRELEYTAWETSVPEAVRQDRLWRLQVYRLALYVTYLSWRDARDLQRHIGTAGVTDQLLRSAGSVGANIAEGCSRGTGADRARFYEYALGSVRECRHWYLSAQAALGISVVAARVEILASIARLLLAALPNIRRRAVRRL